MAFLNIIGSCVNITGLGSVTVNTKEIGAIRVIFTKQAALDAASNAYHTHARGVKLNADDQGLIEVDGVYPFGGFSLSSRGEKPAVFELKHSCRRRCPMMFSGVLTKPR